MNDLISVIVPVYMTERYLDRCIQSLVKQEYSNIEIILVDDGSHDRCPQICDKWAKQDNRIRVIHKKNSGQSDARNVGIAQAHGQYIAFVDSDDYVDERFLKCLYFQILETGAQISCVSMQRFDENGNAERDYRQRRQRIYTGEEAIAALFDASLFGDYMCNKMFLKSLFDSIEFPKGKIMEDLAIAYKLFERCDSISYCPIELYFYFQRAESSMHSSNIRWLKDWYSFSKERYLYVGQKYPGIYDNYRYFNSVILQCYPTLDRSEAAYAKKEFKKNYRYGLIALDWKTKIKAGLFIVSKRLYCSIWKLRQKI